MVISESRPGDWLLFTGAAIGTAAMVVLLHQGGLARSGALLITILAANLVITAVKIAKRGRPIRSRKFAAVTIGVLVGTALVGFGLSVDAPLGEGVLLALVSGACLPTAALLPEIVRRQAT